MSDDLSTKLLALCMAWEAEADALMRDHRAGKVDLSEPGAPMPWQYRGCAAQLREAAGLPKPDDR